MKRLKLIVEKDGLAYFGRVQFGDNLIVDSASTLGVLEDKFKKLMKRFHHLTDDEIRFHFSYDLTSLFDAFSFLKITAVAELAGINASLLRQYVIGKKQASAAQAKKVQDAIHQLAAELAKVEVFGKAS